MVYCWQGKMMYKRTISRLCMALVLVLMALPACNAANPPICPHVIGWSSTVGAWAQGAPWIKVIFSGDIAGAKAAGAKVFYRPWDADSTNHDDGCLPSKMTGSQYADLVWARISGMSSKPEAVGYRNEFNWTDPACSKRTCQQFVNYANRLRSLGYSGKIIFGSFGVGWVDSEIWNDADLTAAVNASDGVETHEYFDFQVSCGAPWLAFRHRDIAIVNHAYLAAKDWYIGEFGSDRVCNANLACADPLCRRGWRDNNKLTEQAYIDQLAAYRAGCANQVVAVFIFQQGDSGPWADFEVLGTSVAEWMRTTWASPTGRFIGTVRDTSNNLIPDPIMSITPGSYTITSTSAGSYSTPALTPGITYSITASKPGFASKTISRALTSGPDTVLDFTLTPITSIASVKHQTTPASAAFTGIVTARFSGRLYVADPNRVQGIAVLSSSSAFPTDLVQAEGTLYTTSGGERAIRDAVVSQTGVRQSLPKPWGLSNLWLGGGALGEQWAVLDRSALGAYSLGLNNVGLLCHVWGSVSYIDPAGTFFYLNDGSGLDDGSGRAGVRVAISGLPAPTAGANASVTGISSTMVMNGKVVRVLRPRCVADLSYASGSNHIVNPGFEVGGTRDWTSYGRVDGAQSGPWFWDVTSHSGNWFFGNATNWDAKTGGLYQRIIARPGRQYQARVWSRVLWSGSYASSAQNRVGIDPTGGTDPAAASIVWSPVDTQPMADYSAWVQLTTPTVTAGDVITIFLDFKQTDHTGWHLNCFDDEGVYSVP